MIEKKQYKAPKGMKDILPEEAVLWQKIEAAARNIFDIYNYREIRTPIAEETGLFIKSVGRETDIVNKEMFSFKDRGERDISLRPEGTAPIVRACIENNLLKAGQPQKLYYIGPMFRAERPQAGRQRQFNQIGCELIGVRSPAADAEIIYLAAKLLEAAGVKDYLIKVNTLGCENDIERKKKFIHNIVADGQFELCEDCKRRVTTNPLRILDCKRGCAEYVLNKENVEQIACDQCGNYFKETLIYLDSAKVSYEIDHRIVRGLDYYTGPVFEIVSNRLGSQDAIGAGGRYDSLIGDLGGPKDTDACGFALGVERIIMAATEPLAAGKNKVDIFIASLGCEAQKKAFVLASELRNAGIAALMNYKEDRKLKLQLGFANSCGAKFALLIGDDEIAKDKAVLRNMQTKEQEDVSFDKLSKVIKEKIEKPC